MERISNDIHELRDSAREELDNFDLQASDKVLAYFSEYPSIAGFPFKILLLENSSGILRSCFRQWDTEYDLSRWNTGIFNLDRLRIVKDEKILADGAKASLKKHLSELEKVELPQTLVNKNVIVLDGSEWKFGIQFGQIKVDYSWVAANKELELFVPIIELMKKQHSQIIKRF